MLFEYAVTPDIFDFDLLNENAELSRKLIEFLRGLLENGMVADLDKGKLSRHIQGDRIGALSHSLRERILPLLNLLHDRHRFVQHPQTAITDPRDDFCWLEAALESDRRVPFQAVVVSQKLQAACEEQGDHVIDLAELLDLPLWEPHKRSISLSRTPAAFRQALAPVLRHAKRVHLVDPYLLPFETRRLDAVRLCFELTGQCQFDRLPGSIVMHAGNPTDLRGRSQSIGMSTEELLKQWEAAVRPLADEFQHSCEVNLWRTRIGGQRFHDRYVFTDQCGIAMPSGLDFRIEGDRDFTTWVLLDHDVWTRRLADYARQSRVFSYYGSVRILFGQPSSFDVQIPR
jgi:hypothetical protein